MGVYERAILHRFQYAVFFLSLYTKSVTAGRGTAWMATEGWMTFSFGFSELLTFVHTVNTFLQPNGTLSCSSLTC